MEHLGVGGKNLIRFLSQQKKEQKEKIIKKLRFFSPSFSDYQIQEKSMWGKSHQILTFQENLGDSENIRIDPQHASDGFLRLLALYSQITSYYSALLLDELEDGMNPVLMESLMDSLVETESQVVFTTHSPMILNYLEDEVACNGVFLIYREAHSGPTKCCRFFDLPSMREKLEYMGPGEVFANVNLQELL